MVFYAQSIITVISGRWTRRRRRRKRRRRTRRRRRKEQELLLVNYLTSDTIHTHSRNNERVLNQDGKQFME